MTPKTFYGKRAGSYLFFCAFFFLLSTAVEAQQKVKISSPKFTDLVISHYNKQLRKGLDVYGPDSTAFWMASLDTHTGLYPEDDTRPAHIPQRAYLNRHVDAPKGATLYWDQPAIVTAYALSKKTKDPWYREKAVAYTKDFLERCVASNGIFLWGNHYYYDAFRDSAMWFGGDPKVVDMATENGHYHEARPIIPAWETFWQVAPEVTEKEIRVSTQAHLVDSLTGDFNRHADGQKQHAFIEAGGTLIYSLSWLYTKTQDTTLLRQADRIATFSYNHRDSTTALLSNDANSVRWDRYTATTETGLWVGCLLQAAQMANEKYREKWVSMADKILSTWLSYAYDADQQQFYGMLDIKTGEPIFREEGDDYPYKPTNYSSVWEPLFPTHNYPVTLAESCLTLYELTGKELYREGCERWINVIKRSLPARQSRGDGAYAEHYGRVIFFLLECADRLNNPEYKALARQVAQEATQVLFAFDMFRSHPGEYRYDATDGVGILSLALLWLEDGKKPDMMGLYF